MRGDARFAWAMRIASAVTPVLLVGIGFELYRSSQASRAASSWHFLVNSTWDPVFEHFGAWPFLYGTLFTTAIALVIAVPLGVATAIFLSEVAPPWIYTPLAFLTNLLTAIPSVVYGLWGIFVLSPVMQSSVEPWLGKRFGFLPLFRGAPWGVGFLSAGIILAIMIVPFIVGVSREVISAVPMTQREAAYALAATRWETIRRVVLPAARVGIWGGVLLGMARALGETMAVTMVIGNRPAVSASLFAPGYTLASVIANEFAEATTAMHVSALLEIGLVLFAISVVVNAIARLLIWSVISRAGASA